MSTSSYVEAEAAEVAPGAPQPPAKAAGRSPRRNLGLGRFALVFALAALIVGFGAYEPSTFLSVGNLSNILGSQAVLFVLVVAVLLPTVMGDFVDLSLGSTVGLSAMTVAVLNVEGQVPIVFACLAGVGVALAVGAVNAYFVVWYQNDPFIVTLGTMTVIGGITAIISANNSIGVVSTTLTAWVFNNEFLSIPLEFYYALAIFLVVWYVLSFTPIGQKGQVTGQSREVARLSGIKVDKMRAWAFVLAAGIAGIAGVFYAGTNGTIDPTTGGSFLLPAFAAVFLGATAIQPGRINALGAFVAVYFLATGSAGLQLAGTQDYIQNIFYGAALVLAITIPKMSRERLLRRVRA